MAMETDRMENRVDTSSRLQPPTLEFHKKYIHWVQNLISRDVIPIPKDLFLALNISPNHTTSYIEMHKVTQTIPSVLPCQTDQRHKED